MLWAFAAASAVAISAASLNRTFTASSSTSGVIARWPTPAASSMWRRIALVEARIRNKQNNLVEKGRYKASAMLGTGSTADLCGSTQQPFDDSSPGTDLIPRL